MARLLSRYGELLRTHKRLHEQHIPHICAEIYYAIDCAVIHEALATNMSDWPVYLGCWEANKQN